MFFVSLALSHSVRWRVVGGPDVKRALTVCLVAISAGGPGTSAKFVIKPRWLIGRLRLGDASWLNHPARKRPRLPPQHNST